MKETLPACAQIAIRVGDLAARHPDRVRSLTLIGVTVRPLTRAEMLPFDVSVALIRATRPLGPVGTAIRRQVAGLSMRMMFGSTFMSDPSRAADRQHWHDRWAAQLVPEGVPVLREVFRFPGNPVGMLAQIRAPTLVVHGTEDPGAEVEAVKARQAIPGAPLLAIPNAGHMIFAEQPDVGTAAITEFIRGVEAA